MSIMDLEQIDVLPDDNVCPFCDAEFLDVEDLQLHMKQLHIEEGRKGRFCKLCIQNFSDTEKYSLHIRNTHLGVLKCCKYCTRLYTETKELLQHEKKHKATMFYPKMVCSNCNCLFENKMDLESHEYLEHNNCDDGLMLQECFPFLSSLVNMNIRKFLEASYSNMLYICAACDMTTPDVILYIEHLIIKKCHSLCCDICFNVYTLKSKLKGHMLRHSNSYNIKKSQKQKKECHRCGENVHVISFKSHLKKCSGMRCNPCNVTFNSINEYTNHVTEHSKKLLPLEVCMYCQRQMVGVEAMEKHIERTHKHEKHLYKYHCIYCEKIFKHPKFLFAHFFSKHKELRPYTCTICDEKFRIRKNFTLHIKLDHNSVGFVEFDDNFHVFFTDKKSVKKKTCQDLLESTVRQDNDTTNAEDSDNFNENQKSEEVELNQSSETIANVNSDDTLSKNAVKDVQPEEAHPNLKILKTGDINKAEYISVNVAAVIESDTDQTDCGRKLNIKKKHKRKPKSLPKLPNKRNKFELKIMKDSDTSSDDSDLPLLNVLHKKSNKPQIRKKTCKTPWNKVLRNPKRLSKTKNKFICTKCNRNCYTFQNYHRHMSLHAKNESKTCIKCFGKFKSTNELDQHMKSEHSSSKLTETLKKLLEKRKSNTDTNKPTERFTAPKEMTKSEKILKTFRKVNIEPSNTRAIITEVDKISVKKYLENFIPETNEAKVTIIPNSLSVLGNVKCRPIIKMTKFTPETIPTGPPKLCMPVKFNDNVTEEYKVSIKLLQDTVNTVSIFENQFNNNGIYDDTFDNSENETKERAPAIPEVAEEVMLEDTNEPTKVFHTMSLQSVLSDDIRIAHLSPQAPYYKIVKIKNLIDENGQLISANNQESNDDVPNDITLPSGKRLVSVNPLAHLLDKTTINKVVQATKSKYNSYKPKPRNITDAIAKAMEKLNQTRAQRKKPMKN